MKELSRQTIRILNTLNKVNQDGYFRIVKPEDVYWDEEVALVADTSSEIYKKTVNYIDQLFKEGADLIMEQLTDSDEGPMDTCYSAWILKPEHNDSFDSLYNNWCFNLEEEGEEFLNNFSLSPNLFYMDYIVKNPSHFILVFSGPE